jgi:hypothetical protein
MTTTNKNHITMVDDGTMEIPPAGNFTIGYVNGELVQMDESGTVDKFITESSVGSAVLETPLTDLETDDALPITEEDSVIIGFGKLQAQSNEKLDSVKIYEDTDSKSEFFHESDGGGYRFTDIANGTVSFAGCNNDPSSDIKLELYSKISATGLGSRLIQTLDKTYYTGQSADSSFTDNDEIATKGDLVGFANPMTDAGDIIIGDDNGIATRLAPGTYGQVLSIGEDGKPHWVDLL